MEHALRFNAEGLQCMDEQGDHARAEAAFRRAIECEPEWAAPWFNLGLMFKYQHNWIESLKCNLQAAKLSPDDEAAWWNAGIAATALGRWDEARQSWNAIGLELPEGEGPLDLDLGMTPIRINPRKQSEVVWCWRIDPARAQIHNIPLPESGHRFGDIVLHDGAPNGHRVWQNKTYAVFDELQIMESSHYATFAAAVRLGDSAGLKHLEHLSEYHDIPIENWANVRWLCRTCSQGQIVQAAPEGISLDEPLQLGLAARNEQAVWDLLESWKDGHPQRDIFEVTCVLEGERRV